LVLRVAAASSTLLSGGTDEAAVRALADEALALFEDRHDDVGQAFAYELLAFLEHNRVRSIPRLVAAERMLAHARAAGATWLGNTAKRQTIQSHIRGTDPLPGDRPHALGGLRDAPLVPDPHGPARSDRRQARTRRGRTRADRERTQPLSRQ